MATYCTVKWTLRRLHTLSIHCVDELARWAATSLHTLQSTDQVRLGAGCWAHPTSLKHLSLNWTP